MDMDRFKPAVDAASLGTTISAIAGWLPSIAALISIIWGCFRIYETRTVQRWLKGRRSPCVGCKQVCKEED